jgi:hypothetical protein
LQVAQCKRALVGVLAIACLVLAPSAWAQSTCDPGLSYSGLVSTNPLAGVHAKLEPLQQPAIQSGWAASWVGVGDPKTVSGASSRAIRVGLIAQSESEISLVYQVHRPGQPVKEREVYRYVKPSQRHSVSVVSGKRHPSRWSVKVDGRRIGNRIQMQPGDGWRAFTTVESAVLASGACNSLAYEVSKAAKARRKRTRHGIRRDWSALTRAFQASGPLLLQPRTDGFVVSTSDSGEPAPDPAGRKLTWAPPTLRLPTTIAVGPEGGQFNLAAGKDYVIQIGDVSAVGGVRLIGGRNVVVIGGHITIPWAGNNPSISSRLGLYLKGQTGTVHVEGLLIDNSGGDLSEGIQINAPDAVVQIENCRVEGIHARDEVDFTDNHPDLIQPWGGVKALRVDRFTGSSDYQGILLKEDAGPIGRADLRRLNIIGLPTARYLFIQHNFIPVNLEDVWLAPGKDRFHGIGKTVWPDDSGVYPQQAQVESDGTVWWPTEVGIAGFISTGVPSGGDFVPDGLAGPGYQSPGYQ